MGYPHVTSFCCCMGLEAGARLIGFLHLIISFSIMVTAAVYATGFAGYMGTAEDAGDHLYSFWFYISTAVLAVSIVHMLLASVLLVAVFKRSPGPARAWVFAMLALAAAALLYVVVAACRGFDATGSDIFIAFVEGTIFYGIVLYCILCVYSYYLMLRNAQYSARTKTDY